MLKIMIVDDMPVFREFLRSAIDWPAYGFSICCEAKNGQEALALAQEHEPDIVLSDITMPFMNGLELAEELADQHPDTAVVLITGNSEFEYARKAVKLGVADYIVKPFEKEELLVTLLSLQDNINRALEQEEERDRLAADRKDQFFRRLIYTRDNLNLSDQEAQSILGEDYEGKQYLISTLEIDADMKRPESSEAAMNWKASVGTMFKGTLDMGEDHHVFTDYEGRVVSLLQMDPPGEALNIEELDDFIHLVRDRLGFDMSVGVGTLKQGVESIRQSYLESINALSNRYKLGANKAIPYDRISSESKTFGFYSAEVNENILRYLQQDNAQRTKEVIGSVFREATEKHFSLEYCHMTYMGLISLLLSFVVKSGKNVADIFPQGFDPHTTLQTTQADAVQRQFILDAYDRVIAYMTAHKDSRSSKVAEGAKRFMDTHYGRSTLTIQDLSKELLVNQTYLRKMFKDELGMTVTEYLTKVRMEESAKLMTKTEYKLAVIAEKVGYSDSGYFSKCFKKYFGQSPSQYRGR